MNLDALTSTLLLAEHGTAHIAASEVGEKYFNLAPAQTARRIREGTFPVRTFQLGGQKGPRLVSVLDLANVINTALKEAA